MNDDAVRCPSCGARNPPTADWCSLCYASLAAEPDVPEPQPLAPPSPVVPSDPPTDAATTGDRRPRSVVTSDGRFRRVDDRIDWSCARCQAWNPMALLHCQVCGAPFRERFEPPGPVDAPPAASPAVLAAMSLVAPGSGHLVLRHYGTGVARLGMFLFTFAGGMTILLAALGSRQTILPAIPLLLGALGLSAASAYDVVAAAQGSTTELLRPRVLLWAVVTVLGVTLLAFVGTVLRVT